MCPIAAAEGVWKLFGVLSALDILVIVCLLTSIALGFSSGFIWQILRIISVVISLWVAWIYHPVLADALSSDLSEPARQIGSAIAVFVGMLLLCYLISYLFRDMLNALKPQLPDRILGGVFGLVKGALLVGVLAFVVINYSSEESKVRRHVEESKAAMGMSMCAQTFLHLLPDRVQRRVAGPEEVGEAGETALIRPRDVEEGEAPAGSGAS
ncbi:MAG: CvpA family protein [Candidatus Brocadiaceae bacterium]|jgi:membrane protein required for colicin V production